MRFLLYILLIIQLIGFYSCSSDRPTVQQDKKVSLIGKWYRFSMANGYTEFDIDLQNVTFYNQKVGRFQLPYTIKGDSLKYQTNQYAAKVINYGDSVLLQGNDSTTATLYKFKGDAIPFNAIPEEKDSVSFASYVKDFDKRLIREFEKAGIEISDNSQKPEDRDYQELLDEKNN